MEIIAEILTEFIVPILFFYPGGFIRWLISRLWFSKKPLSSFVDRQEENLNINWIVALIAIIAIVVYLLA
jgi:uncharacterized Tic20 family protein